MGKTDPEGLQDGWSGLIGGTTYAGAYYGAVQSDFSTYWNTPNPCMVADLQKKFGSTDTEWIKTFSLLSMIKGPWNMTGDANGTLVANAEFSGKKEAAIALGERWLPGVSGKLWGWGGKVLEGLATGMTIRATYENAVAGWNAAPAVHSSVYRGPEVPQ